MQSSPLRTASRSALGLSLFAVCLGAAAPVAPLPPGVDPHEPSAEEAIRAALSAFSVTRSDVGGLRGLARARGLLPRLSGSYGRDDQDSRSRAESVGATVTQRDEEGDLAEERYGVAAEWDLRDLAFNPSEMEVYGLVSIQRDLILEVSRTYFLRQQLIIQRASNPPEDAQAGHILDLRIREFTVLLDAFTDGWFSAETQRRAERE